MEEWGDAIVAGMIAISSHIGRPLAAHLRQDPLGYTKTDTAICASNDDVDKAVFGHEKECREKRRWTLGRERENKWRIIKIKNDHTMSG